MFRLDNDWHFYTTTPDFLLILVVFGLPKNNRHFCIYLFRPVTTTYHFASSDAPDFNLRRVFNHIELRIRITVTMWVAVVTPPSVGQSASGTSCYITNTILTQINQR
jgi:hypothetical protein